MEKASRNAASELMNNAMTATAPMASVQPKANASPPAIQKRLSSRRASCDVRQFVIGVERRRRRQQPFEGGSAHAPGIVAGPPSGKEGFRHGDQKNDRAEARRERADRRHVIPAEK